MNLEWRRAAPLDGELLYRQVEYSIDFKVASPGLLAERMGSRGSTSLSFTTLQLEVGVEHGELLYPWGLFPNTRWQAGRLVVPVFQPGRVCFIYGEGKLQPGVSVPIPASQSWSILFDNLSGWVCFGEATPSGDSTAVEYAKNAAVVMMGGQLVSLWIRPHIVS